MQEEKLQGGRAESCCLPREELEGSNSGSLKLLLPLVFSVLAGLDPQGMWEREGAGSGLGAGLTLHLCRH